MLFDVLTAGDTPHGLRVKYCRCRLLQDSSIEFLPWMLRGRGECKAEAGSFLSALVLAIPSHYTVVFHKRKAKRQEGLCLSHTNTVKKVPADL